MSPYIPGPMPPLLIQVPMREDGEGQMDYIQGTVESKDTIWKLLGQTNRDTLYCAGPMAYSQHLTMSTVVSQTGIQRIPTENPRAKQLTDRGWRDGSVLRALYVLAEDLNTVPSTYMEAHNLLCNSSSKASDMLF